MKGTIDWALDHFVFCWISSGTSRAAIVVFLGGKARLVFGCGLVRDSLISADGKDVFHGCADVGGVAGRSGDWGCG